jgi:signal transduction histidine kinase
LAHVHPEDLLAALLERISDALAVDTAVLLVLDDSNEGDVLVCRASVGLPPPAAHPPIALGQGFAGGIAADRRARVVDDVLRVDALDPLAYAHGVRTMLGVPLVVEGRLLGVLHVGSRRERNFTGDDVELLRLVADRAGLAVDRARLVEAERAAREDAAAAAAALRVREEVFSVAAHELKTPVTSLRGHAQLILRRLDRDTSPVHGGPLAGLSADGQAALDRLHASLRVIDAQAVKLTRLIERLLDATRLESGRLILDPQRADLRQLARDVAQAIQPTADRHTLVVDARAPVVATVDALRLEQVLINLIENAVKFSPAGGEVHVVVAPAGADAATIAVRDHGVGIPVERRAHIFDRFFQAHGEGHLGGVGLGLYVSKQIVELHGGTIAAEFPEDGGTRFVVTLPLRQPGPNVPAADARA